jgi:hypothetical protein
MCIAQPAGNFRAQSNAVALRNLLLGGNLPKNAVLKGLSAENYRKKRPTPTVSNDLASGRSLTVLARQRTRSGGHDSQAKRNGDADPTDEHNCHTKNLSARTVPLAESHV